MPYPVLSPDGKRALVGNKIYNFPLGEPKSMGIPDTMNALAWTPDGKAILYAPKLDYPGYYASFADIDAWVQRRRAQLWLLPLDGSAEPKVVFDQPGFDFARFAIADSYPAVVFSYITIDAIYGARPEIVALQTGDPKARPEWIAVGGQPSVSSKPFEAVGTRVVPNTEVKCPNSKPSRLAAGQRATVTQEDRIKSAVDNGNTIGGTTINERVLLLKPPLCDSLGRLVWFIQSRDGRGWFPESAGDDYWLKP